jgi:hypothetical protein
MQESLFDFLEVYVRGGTLHVRNTQELIENCAKVLDSDDGL